MRVQLLNDEHTNREFKSLHLTNWSELVDDFGLEPILNIMSGGDQFFRNVVIDVLSRPLLDPKSIFYRQQALKDVLKNQTCS